MVPTSSSDWLDPKEAWHPEPSSARQSPLAALRAREGAGAMVRSGCWLWAVRRPWFGFGFRFESRVEPGKPCSGNGTERTREPL
jgi:hypothetical protein